MDYPDYIHDKVIYWYESVEAEYARGFKKVIFDPDMEKVWLKVFKAVDPKFNVELERECIANSEYTFDAGDLSGSTVMRQYLCFEARSVTDHIAQICAEYSRTKDFKNYLVGRVAELTGEIEELKQAAENFSAAFDKVFGAHAEHQNCKHETMRLSCKHAHFDEESRESYRPGLLLVRELDSGRGEFKPVTEKIRLLLEELDKKLEHEEQMRPTKGNQGYPPAARAMGLELTHYFLECFNTPMHGVTSAFVTRICGIKYDADAVRHYARNHLPDKKLEK